MTFPNKWDGISTSRPDPTVFRSPSGSDWADMLFSKGMIPSSARTLITPALAGVAFNEGGLNFVRFTFAGHTIACVDAGANGSHGSTRILTLPADEFIFTVAAYDLVFTSDTIASGAFDWGVGSTVVATDNDVLATTEQDIVAKVDGTLVTNVDTLTGNDLTAKVVSAGAWFNIAIADAASAADSVFTIDGSLTLALTRAFAA